MPITLFPSLSDRLNQLTLAQKVWSAVAGIVLLGATLGYFFLLPRWNTLTSLKEDIGREKVKLAQIDKTKAQMARFKQELEEIDLAYIRLKNMLPEGKEMPLLLKTISDLGQEQGLEFLLFKPEKEIPGEFVAEDPITVTLRGSYHQIGVFFDRLRRLPRIIDIKQLELGAFDEKTTRLNARCQLTTFRLSAFPNPPTAAPVSKKPGAAPNMEKKK